MRRTKVSTALHVGPERRCHLLFEQRRYEAGTKYTASAVALAWCFACMETGSCARMPSGAFV